MNSPLNPASEQSEVQRVNYALAAEAKREAWLLANKEALSEHLERSYEQSRRGELYSTEQARRILAERQAVRRA